MEIVVVKRNCDASSRLLEDIEEALQTKISRLSKYLKEDKVPVLSRYFSPETVARVMVSNHKSKIKIEVTIHANGMIFRGEDADYNFYDAIDRIVDKLERQMLKFKSKLEQRHTAQKDILFNEWPEAEEEAVLSLQVSKTKRFEVSAMTVEEALMRMELVGHSFFTFINVDTGENNIVYSREDGTYGLIEIVA